VRRGLAFGFVENEGKVEGKEMSERERERVGFPSQVGAWSRRELSCTFASREWKEMRENMSTGRVKPACGEVKERTGSKGARTAAES
jgi:hypothetical protein